MELISNFFTSCSVFFKCFTSPSLYYSYVGHAKYMKNNCEMIGDVLIALLFLVRDLGVYPAPLLFYVLHRRGHLTYDYEQATKLSVFLFSVVAFPYILRSYGRTTNPSYRVFLTDYLSMKKSNDKSKLADFLHRYDFESRETQYSCNYPISQERVLKYSEVLSPCSIIGYLFLHTLGIRLIYPGSLFHFVLGSVLVRSRAELILEKGGQRRKLLSWDNNSIDTMFIDRRTTSSINGSTLVICSEGNAGFYEIGIMGTPISLGYSVLGWNHPGFGASTGLPFIEQDCNAMNAVMMYAINELGFTPNNIVLYGWSIGGYNTAWAAKYYPDVKAVVLDATFDDLVPLAVPRMPSFLESLVELTIRQRANLNIARTLATYHGPVILVRRSDDEVISLEPGDVSTNRGNNLLIHLLKSRYPELFSTPESEEALRTWLSYSGEKQFALYTKQNIDPSVCDSLLLEQYTRTNSWTFPSTLGRNLDDAQKVKLTLYLAKKHMIDFASTHCTPLPKSFFVIPTLPGQ